MPADRSIRRDVVVRVPKINIKTRRLSNSGIIIGDAEAGNSVSRRSTSPSKRIISESEIEGKQTEGVRSEQKIEEYEYATQATSAAEWNSLLIWARRQRGPQWDASTGVWQVDQGSSDYYSFGNDPARHTKLSTVIEDESAQQDSLKSRDESQKLSVEEGEAENRNEMHRTHGYSIEDSPPIGPGGRRSRAR